MRRGPPFFRVIYMDDLPHPVTTTDAYLARIVQQNDEIIGLLSQQRPAAKPRRLKEPKP